MLLVTFYGCNKKDVDPVHYFYSIALTFENQSGDNLVTGIPYSEKEQRIPYSEYTRTAWAENGIELLTAELKTIKDENGEDAILLDGMTWEHVSPIFLEIIMSMYLFLIGRNFLIANIHVQDLLSMVRNIPYLKII